MSEFNFISLNTGGSREFKIQKAILKERGYPLKETMDLVDHYYDKTFGQLKKDMRNAIIATVPAGSGKNRIVELLANRLAVETNSRVLPDQAVIKLHNGEAKTNLHPEKRAENPIRFMANPKFDFSPYRGKKAFIIDDVLSTGESTVRMAQALQSEGVLVKGIAGLITVECRKPSERDFQRVAAKLGMVSDESQSELIDQVRTAFGSFSRQRLNRFERELGNVKKLHAGLATVKKLIQIEKEISLSLGLVKLNGRSR